VSAPRPARGPRETARLAWARGWMAVAGVPGLHRVAVRVATAACPPYYGRHRLARFSARGYVAPSASVYHPALRLGRNVFLGDRVVVYRDHGGGPVELGDGVHVNNDTCIQTGQGGRVTVGAGTHIQPRCQLSAYVEGIEIGSGVQIAPNCGLFPYEHGTAPGTPIGEQPLASKGPIVIGDDAWLGFGVVVLAGVRIGSGAVVGAGSVVASDVPDDAVAFGVPARVVRLRGEAATPPEAARSAGSP
jgi:acetyltransferase-like isoleucine patch superfamily enzyme